MNELIQDLGILFIGIGVIFNTLSIRRLQKYGGGRETDKH